MPEAKWATSWKVAPSAAANPATTPGRDAVTLWFPQSCNALLTPASAAANAKE